ncbi:MAG TPA: hypothetical protein VGB17_14685 [Pyrinomonadaceae bacterium]
MKQSFSQGDELERRYQATARLVQVWLLLVPLLAVVAFFSQRYITPRNNPSLDMTWRIAVPILGFGALALRRTRFSAMRLQDIGALYGISGLLSTLQKTTVQVALLGGAIALIGFVITLLTGLFFYTLGAGIIALAVLLYCYPRRMAWRRVVDGVEEIDDAKRPPVKGSVS